MENDTLIHPTNLETPATPEVGMSQPPIDVPLQASGENSVQAMESLESLTSTPDQPTVTQADDSPPPVKRRWTPRKIQLLFALLALLVLGGIALAVVRGTQRADTTERSPAATEVQSIAFSASNFPASPNQPLLLQGSISSQLQFTGTNGSTTLLFSEPTLVNKITFPNTSGVICVNDNNCGYATQAELNQVAGVVQAQTAGVTSINGSEGALLIQGTPNQVIITTQNNAVILSTPQDINQTASPQFGGITLTSVGTQNGFALCDISNNCGYMTGGSFVDLQGATPGAQQTGHLNISGTGIFGTGMLSPVVDAPSATSLTVGGTNATSVTVGSAGTPLTLRGNGSTGLQVTSGGFTNTLNFATPATANHTIAVPNETGTICLQGSVNCGFATSAQVANAFMQNGNSFGATAVLGTNDNFGLNFETAGQVVASIGTSGNTLFKNTTDTTSGFQIQNAAGATLFNADTTNTVISLGSSATTPTLLTLGIKTSATDPAGINGSMYYNSNTGKFRCYESNVWKDCVTSGSGTGDINQGGNSFGTDIIIGSQDDYGFNFITNNTIVASLSNTGQALFQNASNSTTAFQIQNAAGTELLTADTTNAKLVVRAGSDHAVVGSELANNNFSTDWTGTGWTLGASSATHVPGNTNTLSPTTPLVIAGGGAYYMVTYEVTNRTAGNVNFIIGGSSDATMLAASMVTTQIVQVFGTGNLIFTPTSDFDGTISNVSVKQVMPFGPVIAVTNVANSPQLEVRVTDRSFNMFVGTNSGMFNSTGEENVGLGSDALSHNTTGNQNTGVGSFALQANTTGSANTAIGGSALRSNSTGNTNTALGQGALMRNTTGSANNAFGSGSLTSNTTGDRNSAFGEGALSNNTTGSFNTAVGSVALSANTTGSANTAIGGGALSSNTTGSSNVAIGRNAAQANTTGVYNIAIGDNSLGSNINGIFNQAFGEGALGANIDGNFNYAAGNNALRQNTSGEHNIGIGVSSGFNTTTGSNNISFGHDAGNTNVTGSNNTYLGAAAGFRDGAWVTGTDLQGSTAIGYNAQVQANNSIVLGRSGANNWARIGIGITAPSNVLSVSPTEYQDGQASQSGTAISGSGTNWTSNMVGKELIFANGAKTTITGFTSTTALTGNNSQTVAQQDYRIHYPGLQVTSAGKTGINTLTINNFLSLNTAITADNTAQALFATGETTHKGLVIQGVAGQSANLQEWQSSTGTVLAAIDATGGLTVTNATFSGTLTVTGTATFNGALTVNGHIITGNITGSTTIVAEAAAGAGASAGITGNDTSGTITITTGTGSTTGTLVTVTFANAYGAAPRVVLTSANGTAATIQYFIGATGTTTFTMDSNNAPADSSTYIYYYQVMQ